MDTMLQIKVESSVLKYAEYYAREKNQTVEDMINEYLKSFPPKKISLEELEELHPDIQEMIGIIKLSDEELKKTNKELLQEDSVQYHCAIENNTDCIITRNKKDYSKSKIPVYTPTEFIAIITENN